MYYVISIRDSLHRTFCETYSIQFSHFTRAILIISEYCYLIDQYIHWMHARANGFALRLHKTNLLIEFLFVILNMLFLKFSCTGYREIWLTSEVGRVCTHTHSFTLKKKFSMKRALNCHSFLNYSKFVFFVYSLLISNS